MIANTRSRDLRPLILEQRAKLGELLADLDATAWDANSWCRGWLVRDVVAHCIQNHRATPWNLPGQMMAAGFNLDARNQRWVTRWRAETPMKLLAAYLATAERMAFPGFEARYALTEDVVHGYDIAQPLGYSIQVPEAVLVIVAETYLHTSHILRGRQRSTGLSFLANDQSWSAGAGPQVRGPMVSIVLAVAGRAGALEDLAGPGLGTLRRRLAEEADAMRMPRR